MKDQKVHKYCVS